MKVWLLMPSKQGNISNLNIIKEHNICIKKNSRVHVRKNVINEESGGGTHPKHRNHFLQSIGIPATSFMICYTFYTNESPYLNTVKSYLRLNLDIPRHHIQDEFVECFFRVVENEQVDWTTREEVEGLDQGLGLIRLPLLLLSLTTFNPYI